MSTIMGKSDENEAIESIRVPDASVFPYTGIFSVGGLLSSLSEIDAQPRPSNLIFQPESDNDHRTDRIIQNTNRNRKRKYLEMQGECDNPTKETKLDPKSEYGLRFETGLDDSRVPLPPQAFALAIDDILEQIFDSLPAQDLLNCRLVSHHWSQISNSKLRKELAFNFYYDDWRKTWYKVTHKNYVVDSAQNTVWYHPGAASNTLELTDLTPLLQSSTDLNTFLCNQFRFHNGCLGNPDLQDFLNTYGEQIQKLSLNCFEYPAVQSEGAALKEIETLLSTQVVNVRHLQLRHNLIVSWKEGGESRGNSTLKRSDPEFKEIYSNNDAVVLNTQLKVVEYASPLSAKIFEKIIQLSPNLNEISLDFCDLHFLTEPFNRLYFHRHFYVTYCKDFNLEKLQLLETALLEQSKFPPRFSSLVIDFAEFIDSIVKNTEFRRCVVNVINRILESSSFTLQQVAFLNYNVNILKGIKWPPVLPNVTELGLRATNVCGLELFPRGFKVQETFPNLTNLRLDLTMEELANSECFARRYDFGSVPSVQRVFMDVMDLDYDWHAVRENSEVFEKAASDFYAFMNALFPCASLENYHQ